MITLLAAVGVGAWAVSSAITSASDPHGAGEVIKVRSHSDGSRDISRMKADGETVVEHQNANGHSWFESDEAVGPDGKPVICPNGEPLRLDPDAVSLGDEPTPKEITAAQRGVPPGKIAAFNEYIDEFEVVRAASFRKGDVTVMEPIAYDCGPNNEPKLVPLSKVDPKGARQAHRAFERQVRHAGELTGLGSDPAALESSRGGPGSG